MSALDPASKSAAVKLRATRAMHVQILRGASCHPATDMMILKVEPRRQLRLNRPVQQRLVGIGNQFDSTHPSKREPQSHWDRRSADSPWPGSSPCADPLPRPRRSFPATASSAAICRSISIVNFSGFPGTASGSRPGARLPAAAVHKGLGENPFVPISRYVVLPLNAGDAPPRLPGYTTQTAAG